MVSEPRRLGALDQSLESLQMFAIRWHMGTKVHRNPVLDNSIALKNLIEDMQRPPIIDHVVLRDNLEPIHDRFFGENMLVMRHSKSYPNSEVCESIERICWHVSSFPEKRGSGRSTPTHLWVGVYLRSGPIGLHHLALLIHPLPTHP